jgi:hypothetical protein
MITTGFNPVSISWWKVLKLFLKGEFYIMFPNGLCVSWGYRSLIKDGNFVFKPRFWRAK